MQWDVAGLGNALIDALVVMDDTEVVAEFELTRGTMHLVDHARWQAVYERIRLNKVIFDSGGSCANAVATAGYLGASATYVGQVGDDQMGRMYAQRMEEATGNQRLRFNTEESTGKCLSIVSSKDAERTMLTDLGAAISLPDLGDYGTVLNNTKIAHFTGYTLLEGPMRALTIEAMHIAKKAGALVSLDAADPFVVIATKDLLWQLLEEVVDVVFLNADEARSLTDVEPEEAIHLIAKRAKLRTTVVKLGSKGSLVLDDTVLYTVDVCPVKAIDTTGAGDAYAGAFLYGASHDLAPQQCGDLASAVAARTVGQVGAVVKDREFLAETLARITAGAQAPA